MNDSCGRTIPLSSPHANLLNNRLTPPKQWRSCTTALDRCQDIQRLLGKYKLNMIRVICESHRIPEEFPYRERSNDLQKPHAFGSINSNSPRSPKDPYYRLGFFESFFSHLRSSTLAYLARESTNAERLLTSRSQPFPLCTSPQTWPSFFSSLPRFFASLLSLDYDEWGCMGFWVSVFGRGATTRRWGGPDGRQAGSSPQYLTDIRISVSSPTLDST